MLIAELAQLSPTADHWLRLASKYLAAVLTSLSPLPLRLTTILVPPGRVGHSFCTNTAK